LLVMALLSRVEKLVIQTCSIYNTSIGVAEYETP